MGIIDTISAIDSMSMVMPKMTTTSIQRPPAVPPLKRDMVTPLRRTHISYYSLLEDISWLGVQQCVFPGGAKNNSITKYGHKLELSLTGL
jgi:hypothetical protein